jgi:hypothetical protein
MQQGICQLNVFVILYILIKNEGVMFYGENPHVY